ncbi:hypothetical protein B0H63DRAFT_166773 [Podospora didyma]|uniref:Uncharacterized protein n=1 Tax=Podospora didyma TaxID=330526 RepID=A0AAE0NUG1_9PEZI|nr:hypothetical protein B0H63DRAFT_166773 [Podospora didyma]
MANRDSTPLATPGVLRKQTSRSVSMTQQSSPSSQIWQEPWPIPAVLRGPSHCGQTPFFFNERDIIDLATKWLGYKVASISFLDHFKYGLDENSDGQSCTSWSKDWVLLMRYLSSSSLDATDLRDYAYGLMAIAIDCQDGDIKVITLCLQFVFIHKLSRCTSKGTKTSAPFVIATHPTGMLRILTQWRGAATSSLATQSSATIFQAGCLFHSPCAVLHLSFRHCHRNRGLAAVSSPRRP